jgi:hypothetical protein
VVLSKDRGNSLLGLIGSITLSIGACALGIELLA